MTATIEKASGALLSPIGNGPTERVQQHESTWLSTIPKAIIDILSEVKLLQSKEKQEFCISVEIRGVAQHIQELSDPGMDVVIIVDNG